jgi:hypothetical protein
MTRTDDIRLEFDRAVGNYYYNAHKVKTTRDYVALVRGVRDAADRVIAAEGARKGEGRWRPK